MCSSDLEVRLQDCTTKKEKEKDMSTDEIEGEVRLILRPDIENNMWTGNMTTGMFISPSDEEEGMRAAIDGAVIMIAALEYITDNPEFLEELVNYKLNVVKEFFPDIYREMEKQMEDEREYTTDGKVIRLTKWTKTEGNA